MKKQVVNIDQAIIKACITAAIETITTKDYYLDVRVNYNNI